MELNFNYYKNDIIYNKSISEASEKKILDIIKNSNQVDDEFVMNNSTCTEINNITQIRKNIIEWYDFKETNNVLEIGMEYGLITEFLCEKFDNVVSIDFEKDRASIVAEKLSDKKNLSIFVGSLKDIKINQKFDYIVMIGMLENYRLIFGDNLDEYIIYLKSLLKDTGTILLATDNKMGVRYLAGASNEYVGKTLNDFQEKEYVERFNRCELINILEKNGLKNYNFYYPLPDYKMTNVIFSDEFLPTSDNSKLMYNLNYIEGSNIVLNESNLIKEFAKNGDFKNYTNCFFVEIFNNDNSCTNKVKFVSYNNLRKKQYRFITKMYKDVITKTVQYKQYKQHIKTVENNIDILNKHNLMTLDTYDDEHIYSKYCDLKTFDRILIEKIINNEIENVFGLIDLWNKKVLEKLEIVKDLNVIKNENIFKKFDVPIKEEQLEKFNFTKNGLFDLVFENAFFNQNSDFIFYDQEWYEENVPLEFILYRGINNLYMYSLDMNRIIPKNTILNHFGICDECIELFDELEQRIQKKILDNDMIKFISKSNSFKVNLKEQKEKMKYLEDYNNIILNNLKKLEESNNKLMLEFKNISDEKEKLNDTLNNIYNSRGWKLLQKLKGIVRK